MSPHLGEDIRSLSEFKRNTAAMVKRIKRTKRPMVLTVNGKAALVLHEPNEYEKLVAQTEFDQTAAGIREGIADFEAGRFASLNEFEKKFHGTIQVRVLHCRDAARETLEAITE